MSGEAQLKALLEIINNSTLQAIAEYKKGGNQVPTIQSKEYHPIDFAVDAVALKKAVRQLEGACQQLCASLAPPQHTVSNCVRSYDWACVSVVVRAKVADALEKHPNGLHVDKLAKLVNLEKGKLARVLRLLATKGCFIEVEPNVFANNRLSLVTISSSNTGAFWRMLTEQSPKGAIVLYETMTKPEYATSYCPEKAPLIYALGKEGLRGHYFDLLKDSAKQRDDFHRAMIASNTVTGSLSVIYRYPWNEVKTVCDVGASIGTVSLPLSKSYPHLRITDQDLPEVLLQAKKVWAREAPEALQNNQVKFVPLNFLQGSPVHGQDVYYLRHIIHDWPDTKAAVILSNVKKAMASHSRLLIHEYVLTPACRDVNAGSSGVDVAPEPLLANFGQGNNRVYQSDIHMWIKYNAKERTLGEFTALGLSAGLQLEKVYDLCDTTLLEFRVAKKPLYKLQILPRGT